MTRGFLGGILLGTVVCGAAAVVITAVIGPPKAPTPEATALEVPPGSEFQERREDGAATVPATLPQSKPEAAPAVAPPAPDSIAPMTEADTQPAAQPQTGAAENELATPPEQGQRGRVEVGTDSPVLPSPQAVLPVAPESDEGVAVPQAYTPVAPQAAETGEAPETGVDAGPPTPEGASGTSPQTDEEATPETAEAAPDDDAAAEVSPDNEDSEAQPSAPAQPAEPDVQAAEAEAQAPEEQAMPEDGEDDTRPGIGTPAQSLISRNEPGASRLPLIGDQAAPEDAAVPDTESDDADGAAQPPIIANAVPFEAPGEKPLMSIVLIDDGAFSSAVEALSSFPYPLSFAIDPMRAGADAAIARYREAGFEVLALANIPESAAAADVEVNLAALLSRFPQAVAVMEGDGTGLQASRAVSDQVAAYLADSGHGLVMYPNGLDTARKLAEKEGVPAATLFRDFDADGQDAAVIRRFLDQAAFRANQEESGVVMVGRARPETVSALILWGLADRAGSVTLAPVSTLLRARAGMEPAR
ncbi:divergent polysaccharide deacetylase family protein [Lutimaribacter sp. EGI FJ00015]|uniref:Divergent polysaccharide deacetylase family protein n=1 Tax=Lutimaribacter degradans TaxID=2945989 RepID=A0ACC5ZUV9_9RHOB|nr:divergent polysaccharide deacetylase family protein [Lutimaribacter sp. EGI FJ00013]MCM2562129.1 divergent polysaccharide deacetylase family protein [Lutimaribacter sp. EGI FJ00013]MCO0613282.1 divergent polysaccharide deacetylase family protein [Lutimaribacter sp. EGI FJ00015]MCO0636259.1 divergent polysaccharide deacetylase family protein [Lutimaribacter sp. EGI FJ00014]